MVRECPVRLSRGIRRAATRQQYKPLELMNKVLGRLIFNKNSDVDLPPTEQG